MVAPAGVNEGIPQDPAKRGAAGAGLAGTPAAGAKPAEKAPPRAEPADIVPAPAEPVEDELATAAPNEKLAGAEPAADEAAEDELAGDGADSAAGVAATDEPLETELAEDELAGDGADSAAGDGPDSAAADAAEEGRNVSPLAVVGIIIVILALVGVAAGVLDKVTHGFRPKTVVTYRPAAVYRLRTGECVNVGANALDVTVVSCSAPHDAEVFATYSLPETGWPGTTVAQLDASNGCESRLSGYLNPRLATADLTQEYVYPNQAAWRAGERTVVCEVRAASGPLTGSVRAKS